MTTDSNVDTDILVICPPQLVAGLTVAYSWNDPDTQDLWKLTTSECALLPGMTDKGRLGFAVQLKFMELHGLIATLKKYMPFIANYFKDRKAADSLKD